jgi:hypothetical protein
MSEMDDILPGPLKRIPPSGHYEEGMRFLVQAETLGVGTALDAILFALAHAFLGGLSSDLDYQERIAAENARVAKPQPPEYGPTFEEDQDRP